MADMNQGVSWTRTASLFACLHSSRRCALIMGRVRRTFKAQHPDLICLLPDQLLLGLQRSKLWSARLAPAILSGPLRAPSSRTSNASEPRGELRIRACSKQPTDIEEDQQGHFRDNPSAMSVVRDHIYSTTRLQKARPRISPEPEFLAVSQPELQRAYRFRAPGQIASQPYSVR